MKDRDDTAAEGRGGLGTDPIREMNHRVANSLTLVSVLLRRSERGLREPAAVEALRAAAARVDGISRLHRHLYALSGQGSADLAALLPVLCDDIAATLGLTVALESLSQAVDLPADLAADMAMILNELSLNAIKHAYDWRSGPIWVTAERDGAEGLVLTIRDAGPGLPDGFAAAASGGLGMRLILDVVERHGGALSAWTDGGAVFRIGLPATSAHR